MVGSANRGVTAMGSSSGADRREKRGIFGEGDEGEGRGKAAWWRHGESPVREEEIEEDGDFGIFGNWRTASNGTIPPNKKASADAMAASKGLGIDLLLLSLFVRAVSMEWMETNSAAAMLHAPAKRAAKPVRIVALEPALVAPIPIMRDEMETRPSLAPSVAARSQCDRAA
ncbi:hypothetical protein SASPL_132211 [Salvia splendens]|uniref:Uncharacterized protein n=1 Tax=Salvia splendens TaxID=180675 RepID=A0A8X8XA66_SALSN|nr:hypothetical protein SASPL_132211 [Salvia splendens]